MARRAAMGLFAPLAGLYGQSHVMLLCGAVGILGLVLLAFARVQPKSVESQVEIPD